MHFSDTCVLSMHACMDLDMIYSEWINRRAAFFFVCVEGTHILTYTPCARCRHIQYQTRTDCFFFSLLRMRVINRSMRAMTPSTIYYIMYAHIFGGCRYTYRIIMKTHACACACASIGGERNNCSPRRTALHCTQRVSRVHACMHICMCCFD